MGRKKAAKPQPAPEQNNEARVALFAPKDAIVLITPVGEEAHLDSSGVALLLKVIEEGMTAVDDMHESGEDMLTDEEVQEMEMLVSWIKDRLPK